MSHSDHGIDCIKALYTLIGWEHACVSDLKSDILKSHYYTATNQWEMALECETSVNIQARAYKALGRLEEIARDSEHSDELFIEVFYFIRPDKLDYYLVGLIKNRLEGMRVGSSGLLYRKKAALENIIHTWEVVEKLKHIPITDLITVLDSNDLVERLYSRVLLKQFAETANGGSDNGKED